MDWISEIEFVAAAIVMLLAGRKRHALPQLLKWLLAPRGEVKRWASAPQVGELQLLKAGTSELGLDAGRLQQGFELARVVGRHGVIAAAHVVAAHKHLQGRQRPRAEACVQVGENSAAASNVVGTQSWQRVAKAANIQQGKRQQLGTWRVGPSPTCGTVRRPVTVASASCTLLPSASSSSSTTCTPPTQAHQLVTTRGCVVGQLGPPAAYR